MKKMFAMLMLLMLALCCAGAMAEGKVIPGSQLHSNQDASGEGWTWDSSRDELTITKSGLTVKAWKTTNGRIYVQDSCKELTLDQVDIDISDNIPLRINK